MKTSKIYLRHLVDAMILRFALTGMKVSFEVAAFLGRDEVRRRLGFYGMIPQD